MAGTQTSRGAWWQVLKMLTPFWKMVERRNKMTKRFCVSIILAEPQFLTLASWLQSVCPCPQPGEAMPWSLLRAALAAFHREMGLDQGADTGPEMGNCNLKRFI